MIKIPYFVNEIISVLNNNGYEAYIVGGAVRDSILGASPTDYDITTSCPPQKITELFENTVPTGIKHGTVTVIIDHIPTEVTTFRIDGNYSDNRSPDSVTFTGNLADDLSRRDFTVNAIAYCEEKGITDLFGGIADLQNKIIKTVGEPQKRFSEDALRIMRAIRFAATLDFAIEEKTYNAALKLAENLKSISGERIYTELTKAILGKNCEVLGDFINNGGLNALNITYAADLELLNRLSDNLPLRFFSFFKLTDADLDYLSVKLHFSNKLKQYLDKAFYIDKELKMSDKTHIKHILGYTEAEAFSDYLEYKSEVLNEDIKEFKAILKEIKDNNEPYLVSHLAVRGEDLINLGYKGAEIGVILNRLLEAVTQNPKLNTREELLKII